MLVGPTLDMLEHSLIETPAAATSNKHQLPWGLCLAPSSVLLTKALISHADLSYLFSGICVIAAASIAAVGLAAPADAADDETLGMGLVDEDVSDGGETYKEALDDYENTIAYVTSIAEEERRRRVSLGDVLVSPTCQRVKKELPKDLVSLEAARGDGHSLYLNGKFKMPRKQGPSLLARAENALLVAVGAAALSAVATHPGWADAYAFLAARAPSPALYALICLFPLVYVIGYHAGGSQQGDIYAALAHDQKVEEWEKLSTVKYEQPGILKSNLKPALRRSNSRSGLARSNSAGKMRRSNSRGELRRVNSRGELRRRVAA